MDVYVNNVSVKEGLASAKCENVAAFILEQFLVCIYEFGKVTVQLFVSMRKWLLQLYARADFL